MRVGTKPHAAMMDQSIRVDAGYSDIMAVGIDKAKVAQSPRLHGEGGKWPAALFRLAISVLNISDLQDDLDAKADPIANFGAQWMITRKGASRIDRDDCVAVSQHCVARTRRALDFEAQDTLIEINRRPRHFNK